MRIGGDMVVAIYRRLFGREVAVYDKKERQIRGKITGIDQHGLAIENEKSRVYIPWCAVLKIVY